jgi:hypothetical protein
LCVCVCVRVCVCVCTPKFVLWHKCTLFKDCYPHLPPCAWLPAQVFFSDIFHTAFTHTPLSKSLLRRTSG